MPWLNSLTKIDNKWNKLLSKLRVSESLLLHRFINDEDGMSIAERFQKAALDVLMIYAQRIKNVVNNPDHPLEEAVTGKDPFIDALYPEDTAHYAKTMVAALKKGKLDPRELPDPEGRGIAWYASAGRTNKLSDVLTGAIGVILGLILFEMFSRAPPEGVVIAERIERGK